MEHQIDDLQVGPNTVIQENGQINEEPKDPKTRMLHKAAQGVDEEEMEEVVEETKKRFRKRAFDNFYSDDEE